MIIVDEYDSSVNSALLSPTADPFRQYLKYRTSAYFRFFTTLKQALRIPGNRALVVGVTPLAIADFTSGFNIAFDMTWEPRYQDVCGVLVDDIEPILKIIGGKHHWDDKRIGDFLSQLVSSYDGYHFGGDTRVFNSGQLVNCLQHLHDNGKFPARLVDVNTNLSESALEFLSQSQNDQLYPLLLQLLTNPVPFKLFTAFAIDQVKKELDVGALDTLLSLMVYYGALTTVEIDGVSKVSSMCIVVMVFIVIMQPLFGACTASVRQNSQQSGS